MTVVLAACTALIAIAVVTGLRIWFNPRRLLVDDAYTAWFNANSRSGEALRAWLEAPRAARPDAYRAYLAELELEEAAAAELESHAVAPAG